MCYRAAFQALMTALAISCIAVTNTITLVVIASAQDLFARWPQQECVLKLCYIRALCCKDMYMKVTRQDTTVTLH
jgi:hypothetical protein